MRERQRTVARLSTVRIPMPVIQALRVPYSASPRTHCGAFRAWKLVLQNDSLGVIISVDSGTMRIPAIQWKLLWKGGQYGREIEESPTETQSQDCQTQG
jgi:hypothetical protein